MPTQVSVTFLFVSLVLTKTYRQLNEKAIIPSARGVGTIRIPTGRTIITTKQTDKESKASKMYKKWQSAIVL